MNNENINQRVMERIKQRLRHGDLITYEKILNHRLSCPKWKEGKHCSECGYGLKKFIILALPEILSIIDDESGFQKVI